MQSFIHSVRRVPSPRASSRLNEVVEAKRLGVFL